MPDFSGTNFNKYPLYGHWQELCKVPKLVGEGVTCDDLNEGELGNTWFVTACASLAQEPKLWQKVSQQELS